MKQNEICQIILPLNTKIIDSMTLFVRIQNFIKYKLVPPHNMFKHKAERFYFEEYYRIIQPYLIKDNKLLDIGCQNGRFTVPAAKAGMTITSTDIKKTYFSFIEKQIPASHIDFRLEGIDESMDLLPKSHYDVVL